MTDSRIINLSIYRYNPETDTKPYMKPYELSVSTANDPMLLTLLERLKAEQDPTLSFRRSCREGVCGSDGMNINGANGLACITPLSTLKSKTIVVRPLTGFAVMRDLIVDMSTFFKQYERIKPYLQNDTAPPEQERLQSPKDRAKLDGLYECIMCGKCCRNDFAIF